MKEYERPSLAIVAVVSFFLSLDLLLRCNQSSTPSRVIDLRAHLLLSFRGDRSKQLVPRQQSPFCLPPAVELFNVEGLYSFGLCDKRKSSWIWDSGERLVLDLDLSGNLIEVRDHVSGMWFIPLRLFPHIFPLDMDFSDGL